ELVATYFVDTQLAKARKSLRRTQVTSIITILFVLGYMTFLTVTLQNRLLRPKAAAAVATSCVSAIVADQGQELANDLVKTVPSYIAGLPDAIVAKMPSLRTHLEDEIDAVLRTRTKEASVTLGATLDEFLASHRASLAKPGTPS